MLLNDDTADEDDGTISPQSEWDFVMGGRGGPRPRLFQFGLQFWDSSLVIECIKSDSLPTIFLLY